MATAWVKAQCLLPLLLLGSSVSSAPVSGWDPAVRATMSVATGPGQSTLTPTPAGASSWWSDSDIPTTASFAVV